MKRFNLIGLVLALVLTLSSCIGERGDSSVRYIINTFNITSDSNKYSAYNGKNYYYCSDKKIYGLDQSGTTEEIASLQYQTPIIASERYLYYSTETELIQIDLQTKQMDIVSSGSESVYLNTDNRYIFSYDRIEYPQSKHRLLMKRDINHPKIITTDITNELLSDMDNQRELTIKQDADGYQYFYSNDLNSKPVAGVADKNNEIVYRSNTYQSQELLYTNGVRTILSDTLSRDKSSFLIFDTPDNISHKVLMPDDYRYAPQNIFSNEGYLYALLQSGEGGTPQGYYNLHQSKHKKDALVKYDIQNETFEFLYETPNKNERIVGLKDDIIYLFKKDGLYKKAIDSDKKELITKLDYNWDEVVFEMCGNRIFIWNNDVMVFTIEL